MAQNFAQNSLNSFIGSAYETPYIFAAFNGNKKNIELFQQTVEKISIDSKNPDMLAEYKEMMNLKMS